MRVYRSVEIEDQKGYTKFSGKMPSRAALGNLEEGPIDHCWATAGDDVASKVEAALVGHRCRLGSVYTGIELEVGHFVNFEAKYPFS